MKNIRVFLGVGFLLAALISPPVIRAQDNVRSQLFGEADRSLNAAKEQRADIYGVTSFDQAMEHYTQADESYKRGENLEDIRAELQQATALFQKALEACRLGQAAFATVMQSRDAALAAGSPRYTTEAWEKAEKTFKDAARTLEHGEGSRARERGAEAQAMYQTAELDAIRVAILGDVRRELTTALEGKIRQEAPRTLGRAESLAQESDALLQKNRYDTVAARRLAAEALAEARHAGRLSAAIRSAGKGSGTMEDLLLEAETNFATVSSALGLRSRFEEGWQAPVAEALAAIRSRDQAGRNREDSLRNVADALRGTRGTIEDLNRRVDSMQRSVGVLSEAERDLQRKLNLKRQEEETVRQVSGLFTPEEGTVLRVGDTIVVRLTGLSFPVGRNTIEPVYYPLLTKVQNALRKFPGCTVGVEGHTDSQGSDEQNLRLSESRAKAVAEYLMANMNVETPVRYTGFGESRPVASNDTPEGRAKNRRIDVLITPAWAGAGK